MRTWLRAVVGTWTCGNCRRPIAIGDPFLELRGTQSRWRVRRCALCAGEPVPDLPPLPAPSPVVVATPEPIGTIATRLDVKQRQTGERE